MRMLFGLTWTVYIPILLAIASQTADAESRVRSTTVIGRAFREAMVQSSDTISPPPYDKSLHYGMDSSINPCDDFYNYVNGGWRRVATLPASKDPKADFRSYYGMEAAVPNVFKRLTAIIDSALALRGDIQDATVRTVATFYQSCMHADSLESDPFRRLRKVITAVDSTRRDQCIQRVFQHVGDAAGQLFVARLQRSASSAKLNLIVSGIMKEAATRIGSNKLMSAEQKEKATQGLSRLKLRVGIPEEVIDYSGLRLSSTEYFKNIQDVKNYSHQRWVRSIGDAPKDKWLYGLIRANGNYIPEQHAIEIPPIWFFPPFFCDDADDALNFAAAGWVIGHEIYHSIAMSINMADKEMVSAVDSFRTFTTSLGPMDGWATNGNRTWSEDIADLGGARAAFAAWKATADVDGKASARADDMKKNGKKNAKKGGIDTEKFPPDQRFFIAMGRLFRAKWEGRPPDDVHAPPFARVNGTVMQIPEFVKAFGCKAGDRMYLAPDQISQLW